MRAVVFGATGGVGAALVGGLAARADIARVHAVARRPLDAGGKVTAHRADLLDEDALAEVAAAVAADGAPELVIVATGILSDGDALQPEKSWKHLDLPAMERVFRANTFGPALAAKHMLAIMPRQGRAVFAALSARVGSISDNRIGGWHSYRASKAALNMIVRNIAIEQARRNNAFIAVSLHPGTVDTGLSKPFQSNVPDTQLFTPQTSAAHLIGVIDGLKPGDSGKAFDWAGEEIPA